MIDHNICNTFFFLELGEGWEEHRDPYKQGVQFLLKYLGSSLVEEIKTGETYADGRSTEAIRTIIQLVSSRLGMTYNHQRYLTST